MRSASILPLSRHSVGLSQWERGEGRTAPPDDGRPSRRTRPLLAAGLIAAAGALLVGGCLLAARLGGLPGFVAVLAGFGAYLAVFLRGLKQLPLEWSSLRARDYFEYHDGAEDEADRSEGRRS